MKPKIKILKQNECWKALIQLHSLFTIAHNDFHGGANSELQGSILGRVNVYKKRTFLFCIGFGCLWQVFSLFPISIIHVLYLLTSSSLFTLIYWLKCIYRVLKFIVAVYWWSYRHVIFMGQTNHVPGSKRPVAVSLRVLSRTDLRFTDLTSPMWL